jgi:leucyl aminopeptidase (aminopeptidase T)
VTNPDLYRTATLVVRHALDVKPGEAVAVVTDPGRSPRIAEAFMAALRVAGAEAVLLTMFVRDGKREPPEAVQAALERVQVIITPTTISMTYSDTLLAARRRGARVMTMPLINEAIFARAGGVDPDEIVRLTEATARRLGAARTLRLTSPLGTDLHVTLGGHPPEFIDGVCRNPGDYDQVPAGVASVLAAATEGVMVADASVSQVGTPTTPIRFEVRDSRIVAIEGGAEARLLRRILEDAGDPNVYHCAAEVGVGVNRWARHVPSSEFSMEGVRAAGWVHVGFGDDHTLPGGTIHARMHNDALMSDCRLEADGVVLADAGRLVADAASPRR